MIFVPSKRKRGFAPREHLHHLLHKIGAVYNADDVCGVDQTNPVGRCALARNLSLLRLRRFGYSQKHT